MKIEYGYRSIPGKGVVQVQCLHGYGMADSCPGCDAAQEARHTFKPVTFMGLVGRVITRCQACGQSKDVKSHRPVPKARRARNTTRQGANFELQVMETLESRGYTCLRSSGSRGAVDVIGVASRDWEPADCGVFDSADCTNLLFIQCKITNPRISPDERCAVIDLAHRAGALPLVAHRDYGQVLFRHLTGTGPKDWTRWEPVPPARIDTLTETNA
jgi:Holliday junction resolvase